MPEFSFQRFKQLGLTPSTFGSHSTVAAGRVAWAGVIDKKRKGTKVAAIRTIATAELERPHLNLLKLSISNRSDHHKQPPSALKIGYLSWSISRTHVTAQKYNIRLRQDLSTCSGGLPPSSFTRDQPGRHRLTLPSSTWEMPRELWIMPRSAHFVA